MKFIVRVILFTSLFSCWSGVDQCFAQSDSVKTILSADHVGDAPTDTLTSSLLMMMQPGDNHHEVDKGRLAIIGGTMIAAMGTIAIYQSNGYWKDNRAPFHFREDLSYSLWVDKVAHFWDTALLGIILAKSFEWAGMDEGEAVWWGAGSSLLFNTYTEVQDGLSLWGFDRVDWLADVGGAGWLVGKHYWPAMEPFDLKWSYIPSQNLDKAGAFAGQRHLIFDDYEGFTFWLSIKVNSLLPENAKPYWPDFLAIAVGYGARDILLDPHQVWYLSFDWDMEKVIPQDTWFLRALSQTLNYIHFPAPAVRIAPGRPIWYGIYFGN